MKTKSAQVARKEFNELQSVFSVSQAQADNLLAIAYDEDHKAHCATELFKVLTNAEKNMFKRLTTETSTTTRSIFKRSALNTQSARIDNAFTEFKSLTELKKELQLSEARIISHKRHLIAEFSHVCKLVIDKDNAKKYKFELIVSNTNKL